MRLLIILGFIFFGHASNSQQSISKEIKPNFIIIFTDDQGSGDLICFGVGHVQTLNIPAGKKDSCLFGSW